MDENDDNTDDHDVAGHDKGPDTDEGGEGDHDHDDEGDHDMMKLMAVTMM